MERNTTPFAIDHASSDWYFQFSQACVEASCVSSFANEQFPDVLVLEAHAHIDWITHFLDTAFTLMEVEWFNRMTFGMRIVNGDYSVNDTITGESEIKNGFLLVLPNVVRA
jgi:hypothetical protein